MNWASHFDRLVLKYNKKISSAYGSSQQHASITNLLMGKNNKRGIVKALLDLFCRNPMPYFILPNIILIPLYVSIAGSHKSNIPILRYKVKPKAKNQFTMIPIKKLASIRQTH